MVNTIPIEVLGLFMAMSAVMVGIGTARDKGIIILIGGLFILVFGAYPDQIIMGSQVATSTVSGSTTTYTYNQVNFALSAILRLTIVVLGAMVMLVGALIETGKFK